MKQSPLFKKSKIFLIDEVDGIAGREDLGGIGTIIVTAFITFFVPKLRKYQGDNVLI